MDKKARRQHSPQDKVRILRLHLFEEKPISELCEPEGIHPTLFYQWQKAFFENGAAAFQAVSPEPTFWSKRDLCLRRCKAKLRRKDEVIAEIIARTLFAQKRDWGELNGQWVPHDLRDTVVDFLRHYQALTGIAFVRLLGWLGLSPRKFRRWKSRYGKANEHNAWSLATTGSSRRSERPSWSSPGSIRWRATGG